MATVDERMLARGGSRRSFLFLRAPPPPESLVLAPEMVSEEAELDTGQQKPPPLPPPASNDASKPTDHSPVSPPSPYIVNQHDTPPFGRWLARDSAKSVTVQGTHYSTARRTNVVLRTPSGRRVSNARVKEDSAVSVASVFLAPGLSEEGEPKQAAAASEEANDVLFEVDETTTADRFADDTDLSAYARRDASGRMQLVGSPMSATFAADASSVLPSLSSSPTSLGTTAVATARSSMIAEFGVLGQLPADVASTNPLLDQNASFRSPMWHRAVDHRHSVPEPHDTSRGSSKHGTIRNSLPSAIPHPSLDAIAQALANVALPDDGTATTTGYTTVGEVTPRHSRHGSLDELDDDAQAAMRPPDSAATAVALPALVDTKADKRTATKAHEPEVDEGVSVRLSQLTLDELLEQRQRIALEILDTERTYVDRLTFLLEQFRNPLIARVGAPNQILNGAAINEIFKHLDAILNFHRELLQRLEARINIASWNPVQGCLGDIFISLAPYLKVYNMYLGNCSHAMGRVSAHMSASPAFVQFLKEVDMRQKQRGLTLQAYLMEPMQRIPRYRLLLGRLMRKTSVEHPDYEQLKEALEAVENLTSFVNETLRGHDEAKCTIDIQRSLVGFSERLLVPGRRLLKRGSVKKICRKNHQRREFFLFSDILIYSSPGLIDDVYVFHRKLVLEHCKVVAVADNESASNAFQILSPDKSFQVYTDTAEEKRVWMDAIISAIQERQEAQGTLRKEKKVRPQLDSYKYRVVEDYKAPVWVPDEDAVSCKECHLEFRLYRRKHHCRLCGEVVCHACSARNFLIPGEVVEEDRMERACDDCFCKRWGNMDADDDDEEEAVAELVRSRTLNVTHATSLAARLSRMHTISESPAARRCGLCRKDFTVFRWRNTCASCERIVCGECLSKRAQTESSVARSDGSAVSPDTAARICDPCYMGVDPDLVVIDESGNGWRFVAPSGSQEDLHSGGSEDVVLALSEGVAAQA